MQGPATVGTEALVQISSDLGPAAKRRNKASWLVGWDTTLLRPRNHGWEELCFKCTEQWQLLLLGWPQDKQLHCCTMRPSGPSQPQGLGGVDRSSRRIHLAHNDWTFSMCKVLCWLLIKCVRVCEV
jgi:hypothetical protein